MSSTGARAVALLSGGLDSCVGLAIAVSRHGPRVAALHAGYGQRTAARELESTLAIANHYDLETRRTLDLTWLRDMGGSSLTDTPLPVPETSEGDGVPTTYVPFRNAYPAGRRRRLGRSARRGRNLLRRTRCRFRLPRHSASLLRCL